MASHADDLSLLLSLGDCIPESPPSSPSRSPPSLVPGPSSTRRRAASDMSVFRDAVKNYLEEEPSTEPSAGTGASKAKKGDRASSDVEVEKFSGLRLRKCLLSQVDINNYFSDVRFVRLTALRNLLVDDKISGCWATAGVLTEIGCPKLSSNGKTFCVWKMSGLNESTVSVLLFGDAYTNHVEERVGTVFALFNSTVRKDNERNGFCISIFSAGQIVKMGVSADYGVCKGKRNDGLACTMAINKHVGTYCKYHASRTTQRYFTKRTELEGGNLRSASWLQSQGIYMFDPLKNGQDSTKHGNALKVLSVDGLKRALSSANKVSNNKLSQGVRFLSKVTADSQSIKVDRKPTGSKNVLINTFKRSPLTADVASVGTNEPDLKKKKVYGMANMIELDIISSDEER